MNSTNYFEELLQNNIQYGVKKSISSSKSINDEVKKKYPEALLWENNNNEIKFTTKSEFERILQTFIEHGKSVNELPTILLKLNSIDKIMEVDAIICSDMDYNDKIVGLINVMNPSQKLILK